MPRVCCVNNCLTGSAHNPSQEKRIIFEIPQDENIRKKWLKVILPCIRGKKNRKTYYVCELHFQEDDIQRFSVINLQGQGINKIKRDHVTLKPGSVPSTLMDTMETVVDNLESVAATTHNKIYYAPTECLSTNNSSNNFTLNEKNVEPDAVLNMLDSEKSSSQSPASIQDIPIATEIIQTPYNLLSLKNDLVELFVSSSFPLDWTFYEAKLHGIVMNYYGDLPFKKPTKQILVKADMIIKVYIHGVLMTQFNEVEKITSLQDVLTAITTISELKPCQGVDENTPCENPSMNKIVYHQTKRCNTCKLKRKRKIDSDKKKQKRSILKSISTKKLLTNLKRQYLRSKNTLAKLKEDVATFKKNMDAAGDKAIKEVMSKLPATQREAVQACIDGANYNGQNGMRYTNAWILECILLRIKSRRSYEHIRKHKLMQVPTIHTLNKYMKVMKPSYGFQDSVFELLKKKSMQMDPFYRRGTLIVDEMKVSEGFSFDRTSLKFVGLVDLGKYTPEKQATDQGDHALVFMFQPFAGQWVQTVGAFLSKGCASGSILHQLILECSILLENAGFFVDVVTTDGASWNRLMWKKFGLHGHENSIIHPCRNSDSTENSADEHLFFCSDYSHLHKLLRNFLFKYDEVMTPEGKIQKKHWRAVIELDGGKKNLGLKVAYKLTEDHLNPQYWQKMNVAMAFEVFSERVVTAMEMNRTTHPDLLDCEATVKFIRKIQKVITAMTSRTIQNALEYKNEHYIVIEDFRLYLQEWRYSATTENWNFMSDSTYDGFLVTLKTTIGVMDFLSEKCGYTHLMTTRLNQDALEAFFGMIRSACGSTDHPDSLLFIQVYRLLSFYSLVKPPKGSNVEGMGVFEILFDSKHIDTESNENKLKWDEILDDIVKRSNQTTEKNSDHNDHDYNTGRSCECVVEYMAGFLSFKMNAITSCSDCINSTRKEHGNLERDKLIDKLSNGYLKYPSDSLYNLINAVEIAILKAIGNGKLSCYSFLNVANQILKEETSLVGCCIHEESLTKAVINIYAIRRAQVISKQYGKMNDKARKEEKQFRKRSKIVKISNKLDKQLTQKENKTPIRKQVKRLIKKKKVNLVQGLSKKSVQDIKTFKKTMKRL